MGLHSFSCTSATNEKGTVEFGCILGFFFEGALAPLRSLPAGISAVADLLGLELFLTFTDEKLQLMVIFCSCN